MIFFVLLAFSLLITNNALDNGLARTPPMGWMSWAKFLCQVDCVRHPFTCINENLYMQMADRLSEDGYLDAGYEYIHIDDCWMELKRSPDGLLVANRTRFPSGIAFLRNYVHRKGLKLGIYVDVGSATCEGYPGSFGHFETDVKTFAKWGIDYLKADGCNLDSDLQADAYIALGRAINATAHPMVYGTEWPLYLLLTNHTSLINYSAIGEHCNVFRNFWDANLSEKWLSVQRIIDFYGINQDKFINASGPGRWLDPDEIVVGNEELTIDQSMAQMTIWSIWSAPLIMSSDLRLIRPVFKKILLNKDVIAIDQDPLGMFGRMILNETCLSIYVKPVTPYRSSVFSYAIALLNRCQTRAQMASFVFKEIGLRHEKGYRVKDLWTGEKSGIQKPNEHYRAKVRPTSARLIKATAVF